MQKALIKQLILYKHRYPAGILFFGLLLGGLLLLRLDLAPTGFNLAEMQSVVRSATLQIDAPLDQSLIDAPYHLLQKASLSVLGLNEWGILAPSLLLGAATGVAFIMMVRRWFRMNVALITSVIFVSSAAFLSIARTGTPMIMTTFWLSIILLAVTNILHPEGRSKLWGAVLLVVVPLSLYTPLMAYPLFAIAIAGILHPHVRFVARHIAPWKYFVATVVVLLLVTPLVITVFRYPESIGHLLGLPKTMPSMAILSQNATSIVTSFFSVGASQIGMIPQPIFGAASLIIITLGFFKTIADRYSARSYMLLLWSTFFIPLAFLNPDQLLICLVPAYLFMAIGIETLIREWYKLFPLNPYARLAGLLPLTVLLGGIVLSNSAQYFYGYFYGVPTEQHKQQLEVTNQFIADTPKKTSVTVVVVSKEIAFYDLLRRDHENVSVTIAAPTRPQGNVIVHQGAMYAPEAFGIPTRIVASYKTNQDQVIAREFRK